MADEIKIMGFSHFIDDVTALINEVNSLTNTRGVIQLLDADGIAGEEHAIHAVHQAFKSFRRQDNIASDMGLEICVRASAQRQISRALELLGLKKGHIKICAVLLGCDKSIVNKLETCLGDVNDKVLEPEETCLKKIYNISDEEIESAGNITRVMVERTSLLVLETW